MLHRPAMHLWLLLAAAVGCGPGTSIVTVTLDAQAPIGPIAHLSVTATNPAGKNANVTVPVGASIPPTFTFSLKFPASVDATIHLAVQALDGNGAGIGSGAGDVRVKPSETARLPLTLSATVPVPAGAKLVFTSPPADARVMTALAPVRVGIVDAQGMPISDAGGSISIALGHANGATLSGTLTVAAIAGVATFSDLQVDRAGTGYTLVASAAGTTAVESGTFAIRSMGWVPENAGLTGGVINDLVLDPKHPGTLYAAAADNGVWKSIDGGTSWARASAGLPRRKAVDALAIDPTNTTTVWATAGDAGVYKSTNGGASWVQSSTLTVSVAPKAAIAVDPAHPGAVYAAQFRAVARTLDGGATWTSVATNDTYGSGPRSIAIHPTTGDVWVAQFGGGLARAAYNSSTFVAANGSGTNIIPGTHPYMKCIAFDPWDPTYLYASGDFPSPTPTVFVSSDGGNSWVGAAAAPAAAPIKMAGFVGPGGTVRMYGAVPEQGIVSTTMARNKWDYPSSGITGANAVAVDPGTQNLVYAATSIGVARTTDSFNFTGINNGLVGQGIWTVAFDPKNRAKIYVGMRDGIFRSTDAGQSWSAPSSMMPGAVNVYGVAVAWGDDKQLALGTDNWGFTSADFGASWTALSYGATIRPLFALASSPSETASFWAGGSMGDVYHAVGGATAWSPAGGGLPSSRVNALVVHPTNPMIVYAATAGGVYQTTNAGAAWTQAAMGMGSISVVGIAIDSATPATLYAATSSQGVYKTTNGGGTWSAASSGLASMNTVAVAVAPSQPATVYVATDQGVYQSLDGAGTWSAYSTGLGAADVTALAVDPADPLGAVVSTWDGGFYRNVTQ